jgi:hypothetical protein
MSSNLSSGNSIAPLSIGNVVSAGLWLYRSHLKTYFQLALTAYLWILVPIYGWAKFMAISGLISRLAFGELISQPESVKTARSQINPRLWSFLRVAFQVGISLACACIGLTILDFILAFILILILVLILRLILGSGDNPFVISPGDNPFVIYVISILLTVLFFGILVVGLTWYYSRWMVAEVTLAVEEQVNGGKSIARSWELTKGSVFRIQGIVLVAFVISSPIVFLFSYLPDIFLFRVLRVFRVEGGSTTYWIVYFISLLTSLVGVIFVMPFWQSIKAVLYCDLRSRREGFGLQLRDRNS